MTSAERDDLDQAYARAHALADAGRGPAASVRANVLAAAAQVAAQADAKPETRPTLTPVAAPVSDVARGRLWALNLSSWRVRSGAALCAVLVVGLASWRFDASRRLGADMQVASADSRVLELKVVEAPALNLPPPPKDMPMPSMASPAVVAPPPAVDAATAPALADAPAEAKALERRRDTDLVVAQADQPYRANSMPSPRPDARQVAPQAAARAPAPPIYQPGPAGQGTLSAALAPPPVTLAAAAPPRNGYADVAPPASPPLPLLAERRPMMEAPPVPVAAPEPVGAAATAAAGSQPRNTVVAAAQTTQRVEIAGNLVSRGAGSESVRGALEKAKKAAPAPVDKLVAASLAALPSPLHAAAGNNDVDTLHKLLAKPATRVDLADAQGRTPLLVAVAAQHVAAVRVLLAAGADPDRADATGATPRSVARTGANAEIAALFAVPR